MLPGPRAGGRRGNPWSWCTNDEVRTETHIDLVPRGVPLNTQHLLKDLGLNGGRNPLTLARPILRMGQGLLGDAAWGSWRGGGGVPWSLVVLCCWLMTWLDGKVSVIDPSRYLPLLFKKKKKKMPDLVVVKFKKASAELGGISLSTK